MNFGFDLPTIKYLRGLSESIERTDKEWYAASYISTIDLLRDRKMNNIEYSEVELKLAISLAYSWMPRIPNIVVKNWEELTKDINNLGSQYSLDEEVFMSTLKKCVKQIDKSVIGFSKVLHFLFPDKFAILDNRVKKSWNNLFPDNNLSYKINEADFIKYQKEMNVWAKNSGKKLREIEFLLFRYSSLLQSPEEKTT